MQVNPRVYDVIPRRNAGFPQKDMHVIQPECIQVISRVHAGYPKSACRLRKTARMHGYPKSTYRLSKECMQVIPSACRLSLVCKQVPPIVNVIASLMHGGLKSLGSGYTFTLLLYLLQIPSRKSIVYCKQK